MKLLPPVDQNQDPQIIALKAKLADRDKIIKARESVIFQQNDLIASLDSQIEKCSDKPYIITKLQDKIAILKQKSAHYLVKNQTVLLASGLIGLAGIAGLQSMSINSLQDQIDLNSDLGRKTDEKMIQALDERSKGEKQEFDDKIQKLQQEMQDLKNKQTSTLLPQNSNSIPNLVPNKFPNQQSNSLQFNPQSLEKNIPQNIPQITLPQIPVKPLSNNLITQKELIQPLIQEPAQSTPSTPTPQENQN